MFFSHFLFNRPETASPSGEYDSLVLRNEGLGQLFYRQYELRPYSLAMIDGEQTQTYAELHAKAKRLAQELHRGQVKPEESVGILVKPGVWDIITQMGVIYAGASCVPLDPALSDQQIKSRLERLGTRYILVDSDNCGRALPFQPLMVDRLEGCPDAASFSRVSFPVATPLEHRTHIIHTSGTTSEPKAVQILGRSILQVVHHAPFKPLEPSDRVAHMNNTSFDVALFDVWAPLLRGASISIMRKEILLDPKCMADHIARSNITVMATTTALLNLAATTYPQAFARLKTCFIGGEAANPEAIKVILREGPPGQLINAYGPTECCIFCLAHRVTADDMKAGSVSIGKPIGQNTAFILNEKLELVDDGEEGELFIEGAGVSRGYANQSEKTAQSFLTVSHLTHGTPIRLYRTGDIVKRDKNSQEIYYIGRRDHQVKIRGYRIEIEAVEGALLKTGKFSQAVALKIDLPMEGAGSMLVAFAVPASPFTADAPSRILNPDFTKELEALLPPYMIPRIELIEQLPLNSHGKVDRAKLTHLYLETGRRHQSHENNTITTNGKDDTLSQLGQLWGSILASPVPCTSPEDDFFLLGGTSLQAAILIDHIHRAFGIEVSLLTLYDHSTLLQLSKVIDEYHKKGGAIKMVKDEREIWLADSHLVDQLEYNTEEPVVDWTGENEGRVFLTGATGFVGAFFLAELLAKSHVHQAACLVRARDPAAGMKRLQAALSKYGLWKESFKSKILVLCGSLENEFLGLGKAQFDKIALWASVVYHLGARVNYTQPYSVHRPANTQGTLNVLDLAFTGRTKAVHYVSSLSCFGPTGFFTGAKVVSEDDSLVKHLDAMPYDHGYSQSQWVVDQMLCNLIDRGFPIAIYRPGFITGHSVTGACNPDDFFSRMMDACHEMGCFPLLPNQRKEFIPVDYANSVVLHISSSNKNLGRAYHIVPPQREMSPDMDETMRLVGEASQQPEDLKSAMVGIPYADWIVRLCERTPKQLKPLQPMLAEKVHQGLTRWELYENMPVYETTNTTRAMADYPTELKFPSLDATLLNKYMNYWR